MSAPGIPPVPTKISVANDHAVLNISTTGVTGDPFTRCDFVFSYTDASGSNTQTATITGAPDANGTYTLSRYDASNNQIIYLNHSTNYTVTTTLYNINGSTSSTATPLSFTTTTPPPPPTLLTLGNNYVSFFIDRAGIPNIYPNNILFIFQAVGSSQPLVFGLGFINTIQDASGNYTFPRYLFNVYDPLFSVSTAYTIKYRATRAEGSYGDQVTFSEESLPLSITTLNNTPPSTPTLTLVSKTSSSVTLSVSTTGLNGSPFIRCEFRIVNSNGNLIEINYLNVIDGAPDASGNYTGTITAPSYFYPGKSVFFKAILSNEYDDSLSTALPITISHLDLTAPTRDTSGTNDSTTISLVASVNSSYAPGSATFTLTPLAGGSPITITILNSDTFGGANPDGYKDASGNFYATFSSLNSGSRYRASWYVTFDTNVNNPPSPSANFYAQTPGSPPGIPPVPSLISLPSSGVNDFTRLYISTAGITGEPFTQCDFVFTYTDASGSHTQTATISDIPDASGNYTLERYDASGNPTIYLNLSTQYTVTTTLYNTGGSTSSTDTPRSFTTATPLPSPTVVSLGNNYVSLFFDIAGLPFTTNYPSSNSLSIYLDAPGLQTTQFGLLNTEGQVDASGNYILDRFSNLMVYSYFKGDIIPLIPSTTYTLTYKAFSPQVGVYTIPSTPLSITTTNNTPPSTPSVTLVSQTSSSVTLSVSTTGLDGSPFIYCLFVITNSLGELIEPDYLSGIDGAPDASDNYTGTITAPYYFYPGKSVFFKAILSNEYDDTISTLLPVTISPLDLTAPTRNMSGTNDSTTISLVASVNSSYAPDSATFTLTPLAGGSPITITILNSDTFGGANPDGYKDASGNFHAIFSSLDPGNEYSADWYVTFDTTVNNPPSSSANFTAQSFGSPPDAPPIPTLLNNGSTSITVSISTVGLTGAPFTGCVFTASTPGGSFSSTITGSPDASGNYTGTITGLSPPTVSLPYYEVVATLSNSGGSTPGTNLQVTTLNYANGATLVSKTTNGIIVSGNLSTDTTGASITGITNVVINYTRISNGTSGTGSVTGPVNDVYTGTLTGLTSSTNYNVYFTFTSVSGDMYSTEPFNVATNSNPVCFKRGSKILCLNKDLKEEYVPVEQLRKGDLVKTLKQSYVRINLIGKSMINNPDNSDRGPNRLFKLTKENYPGVTEDLVVTGCHSILVERLTPKQKERQIQLMGTLHMTTDMFRLFAFVDERAEPYMVPGEQEIWHFALDNDNAVCNYGVYANGLLVETASLTTMKKISGIQMV